MKGEERVGEKREEQGSKKTERTVCLCVFSMSMWLDIDKHKNNMEKAQEILH